jgi:hypothetical protein
VGGGVVTADVAAGVAVGDGAGEALGTALADALGEALGAALGDALGAALGVALGAALGVVAAAQLALETVFASSVTAPVCARALPDTLAPVCRVMLVCARMLPANAVRGPMVAEPPITQNTLQGDASPTRATLESVAVVSVLGAMKMKTPPPLSVKVPVSWADEE